MNEKSPNENTKACSTEESNLNAERLASFEKMLSAITCEHQDMIVKMDKLKEEGKTKSVTYMQLLTRKLMYTNILSLYEIYGLIPDSMSYHK